MAQPFGDGAHGVLRAGVDRLERDDLEARRGNDVDEMPETLAAKDGQCLGDAVQNALEIGVDHRFPIFDAQIVEQRNWPNPRVADENVELAESLARQRDEAGEVEAYSHVRAGIGCLAARGRDAARQSRKPVCPARSEHDLRAALSQQQRSRLADAAARACDYDDLALDSRHEVLVSTERLQTITGAAPVSAAFDSRWQ